MQISYFRPYTPSRYPYTGIYLPCCCKYYRIIFLYKMWNWRCVFCTYWRNNYYTILVYVKIRLSEFAVAVAYGPALFGGVYYVMTKTYSWDAIILSIPSMLVTVTLLYIHTVMDFDFDLNEGHKTVANSFNSQLDSLIVLKWLLILAYVTPLLLCIFDILDWQVFIVWFTIPLAVDLYKSMVDFSANAESIPEHKWYHFQWKI